MVPINKYLRVKTLIINGFFFFFIVTGKYLEDDLPNIIELFQLKSGI